jgi:peptidoglycan/LPS O-acetylase OafA/YrhL
MPARMDALFLGVLCAYLLREPDAPAVLLARRKQLVAAFVLLGIGVVALTAYTPLRSVTIVIPVVTYGYTLLALFYTTFLLLAVTAAQSWPARVARLPFLRQLGFITYGVYLFHQGINGLFHGLILRQLPQLYRPVDFGVTLLALATTVALAYLSWHTFEKGIVRWGHSFQYQEAKVTSS